MKLVDILARELTEWPAPYKNLTQSAFDTEIYNDERLLDSDSLIPRLHVSAHHSESITYPIVSKPEWESARAAYLASIQQARDPDIAAVVDKPANPWRRNRGRKTPPVHDGVMVDYKLRGDDTCYSDLAEELTWHIDGDADDIMQWRYAEPQQSQEKPMAQTIEQVIENAEAACEKLHFPFKVCNEHKDAPSIELDVVFPQESFILPEEYGAILDVEVKDDTKFNPIALRDEYKRITLECEELSKQMGKLTDRMGDIEAALRAEGFALIDTEGK